MDFTLLGDPLDIVKQGWNYYTGQETDEVIAGLAVAGMILTWWPTPEYKYGAVAAKHTLKAAKSIKASPKL